MRPIALLALLGCPDPDVVDTAAPTPDTDEPVDTSPPPTQPVDTGLPPGCPPLVVTVDPGGVPANRPAQFRATGGSGQIVWSFDENRSGGLLNPSTGTYLAGPLTGVRDDVRATDAPCALSATDAVEVLDPLRVLPAGGRVRHGDGFALEITGGSAQVACSVGALGSGGSLVGCAYTAGPDEGLDLLRVDDTLTGERVEVALLVGAESGFGPAAQRFAMPVGVPLAPRSVGGTGTLDVTVPAGALSVVDGALVGSAPGRSTVSLSDRFTGESVQVTVDVVAPLTADNPRDGERGNHGVLLAADLNGDGYTDAVLGTVEVSVGALLSGAAVVYAGGPNGLDPVPAQVFGDAPEGAGMGRALALGDFDGDGALDLAIGADADGTAGATAGVVVVHRGLAAGFFDPTPTRVLYGAFSGDRQGHALAACDVDGDGFTDLIVGAPGAEDRTVSPQAANQGGLRVYRGGPFGLPSNPSASVWGRLPVGGAFTDAAGLALGRRIAAGDADGDGICDVAAASELYALDGAGQDGLVALYTGGPAGLGSDPARVFALQTATDTSAQFGYALALGDLDGDGLDDLAVGSWAEDAPGASAGAVRVFLAANHDGPSTAIVSADDADAVVFGDNGSDQLGFAVAIADGTGDGAADLLIGAPIDEAAGSPNNVGVVWAFAGDATGLLSLGDATPLAIGGEVSAWFGAAFAVLGDGDADGVPELAVFAPRDSAFGPDAGAAWWVGPSPARLDLPGEPAGGELGSTGSFAWADVDGDGALDLVAGAPEAADVRAGSNSGRVRVFAGGAGAPSEPWGGHALHGVSDRFGAQVVSIGDFDGDGHGDLAIVARTDGKPATFPPGFDDPDGCAGSLNNAGAVWIHPGGPSGVGADPIFVVYGSNSNGWVEWIGGGFDRNGDGRADLALGGPRWSSNLGGARLVHGRARQGSVTTVICSGTDLVGASGSSGFGRAMVGLGDLDGDGCDEIAIGADGDDLGATNQGAVRLIWGSGGSGCPASPQVSTLVGGAANARAGERLAAGSLDGDALTDLVVGMPQASPGGRVAVVRGSALVGLPRQALVGGALAPDGSTTSTSIASIGWTLDGEPGERLGEAVAVAGSGRLGVGAPGGALSGAPGSGGARIHAVGPGGIDPVPALWFGGRVGGRAGAGLLGRSDGALVVGAPRDEALVLAGGALVVVPAP